MSDGPIEIGPVVITVPISPPNPPLPPPPVVVPGVPNAQPPQIAKVPLGTDVEALLSLPNIRSAEYVIPIAGKAARAQVDIESAYNANLANIPAETDSEVATAVGDVSTLSPLEKAKKEKSIIDALIKQKQDQLVSSTALANSFFGRDLFAKTVESNGAELSVAIIDNTKPGTPLEVFKSFTDSVSATYESKVITEKIRLLTEKSAALTSSIATDQAAEDARLAAEAEAQRVAAEAEAQRVAAEAEAKRIADEAAAAEAARIAAEAEAKRVADEAAAAEAARVAAEIEAKRIADEAAAAEAARIAAEAEAQRVAAEQARLAAEAVRIANTFRAPGPASAAGPLFMTSAGTVAVVEAAALTLQAAIRAAITALGGVVASVGAGFVVGVSALFYSSKLANGELPERYAFSTPVSDLASDLGQDLNAVAAAGGTVDLPYRISSKTAADGRSEVFVVKTDGVAVPSKVRVVAATYDATQKIYTATTADVPPRTLTWTPIVNPGNSSTTSPAEQPVPPVYTGATVTPVEGRIDTFPAVSEASFDDFITVFPADSGLPPIYTMFRDRREDPGIATGVGQPVSGIWLGAASQGEGAPIPSQIADQLRGKEFKNFREFRETLWKAVANDPELSKQFSSVNLARMKNNGYAPYAIPSEQVGGKVKFEIHHVVFLKNNGELYGIDNLRVVTPKEHDALHSQKVGE